MSSGMMCQLVHEDPLVDQIGDKAVMTELMQWAATCALQRLADPRLALAHDPWGWEDPPQQVWQMLCNHIRTRVLAAELIGFTAAPSWPL